MKSRSHRLPISDTHEDWVDGSWTVECVCGVNFDDGEEMVNCDECGVWVHTRCSRYVKTDKSFACHKCKSKNDVNNDDDNNDNNSTRNDAEETEVAQLLVELPTKTLRMDNPYPSRVPCTRPYRLWTNIPLQERVHVQGVPGGDPALFAGLSSSIFTPRLWKSTGYVPKKFNFRYREFPCWDQEGQELVNKRTTTADHENTAGVLFSLSKDNMSPTPLASSFVARTPAEDHKCAKAVSPQQMNKLEAEGFNASLVQSAVKKDPISTQPSLVNPAKYKKEETGLCKDPSERKKAQIIETGKDSNKKTRLASRTAFTISSDEKQLEFHGDRGPMSVVSNTQTSKAGDARADGHGLESSLFNSTTNGRPEGSRCGYPVALKIENFHKSNNGAVSGSLPIKDEVVTDACGNSNDNGGGSTRNTEIRLPKLELIIEDVAVAGLQMKDTKNIHGSNGSIVTTSLEPNAEMQRESDENQVVPNDEGLPLSEGKLDASKLLDQPPKISAYNISGHDKLNDAPISSSEAGNHKVQEVDKSTTEGDDEKNKTDDLPGGCQPKRESTGSEGSLGAKKISSAHTQSSKAFGETSKSSDTTSLADLSQHKVVVSFGKSSSTTSACGMSKSPTSGSHSSSSIQIRSINSGQKGISDGNCGKNGNTSSDAVRDEAKSERLKKIAKELPKSSASSTSKTSQSAKFSHASVYRRGLSDSKDFALRSSSKESMAPSLPDSGVSASSLQTAGASNAETKASGSISSHTSEKSDQPAARHSSKVNASHMQPPVSSNPLTTLSDEELALLLHQELNSSPRVPRVPRMRHAGNLPQLTSPTATGMLMKRTSASGGKACSFSNRRKSKDSTKDGSHSSRDVGNESKKTDRVSPSPDHGGQDSACTIDPLSKKEVDSGLAKDAHVVKENNPPASTSINSVLSSSTEVNEFKLSSSRNSPRNASDDDSGAVGRPTHLTLPGLIAEIMSKGKRMTYEELCNVVLPHWPHLRKHNGERYAYSSHSQAVLDCLRNRSEWARLVDRGPKTSASRKRRKVDPSGAESGDNGDSRERKGSDGKSLESQQEEFPKGKRQARKRRRLALKGRGVKDLRWRRRAKVISDDDIGSLSNSSSGSLFSEGKTEGVGTSPGETEDSASSGEAES